MKAEKKIVDKIVENLQSRLGDFTSEVERYIKHLKDAKTVEEVMILKRRILEAWVSSIPLWSDTCYFCIKYKSGLVYPDCECCQYAEHHGICVEKGSSWHKINSLRWKLYDLIVDEYYKGEVYEQETNK
ncbi:MAG: hypothetical protein DRP01_01020 [Archaeoglobales archaeon]|nr:MAG: hypothetical protein DRP01_01020 [Archaeoglobales archaeon]